ncbi:MAG TPA: PEP-CTERM sorting domain-containing protein [Trichocoleus sp.]|jgi:hypothetical protein
MKQFFLTKLFPSVATLTGLAALSSILAPVQAASLSFSLSPFTGSTAKLNFTLDDQAAGAGKVLFKVDVDKSVSLADIRGIFFNIKDDSLLPSLKVTGTDVTAFAAAANGVSQVGGNSNNLNGGGTNYAFDAGVEIGEEGLKGGKDDFQSTSFIVSAAKALDLSQFSTQGFGARLMSVGTVNDREGSSKLTGASPNLPPVVIPPTTPPTPPVVPPTPPNLPPVVVVPPTPKPPAKVPEPGTIAALSFVAVGAAKFLKRKEEAQA